LLFIKFCKGKRPFFQPLRDFTQKILHYPSHTAGHYSFVPAIAKAAVAAGADGLLIEVHPNPKEALVDGIQSLSPSDFARLMKELRAIAKSTGRFI